MAPWNKGLKTGTGPWCGKRLSSEHRQKIGNANRGKVRTEDFKRNVSLQLSKRKISSETRAKLSRAASKRRLTPELKEKLRLANIGRIGFWTGKRRPNTSKRGQESNFWGRSPAASRGIRSLYKGIFFRSTYEYRFAKALDARGIAWQYEPKRFDLGACTYLPDFFVPDTGAFWEIKGWHNASSQMKARLFREQYPEHPLIIATHEVLTMMEGSTNGCRDVEDRSPVGESGPLAQQCAKRTA